MAETETATEAPSVDSVRIQVETDTDPDLSYYGEYSNTPGPNAIDRQERGDMLRGEYRYFSPAMTGEESGNPDSPEQDYQRMEDYNRQGWGMVGVVAIAKTSRQIQHGRRLQSFSSGGVWGIESDSGDDELQSIAEDELADLREHLLAYGVELPDWDELCKDALASM